VPRISLLPLMQVSGLQKEKEKKEAGPRRDRIEFGEQKTTEGGRRCSGLFIRGVKTRKGKGKKTRGEGRGKKDGR